MTIIPQRLFLEVTTECNLRCKLCTFWQNKDPRDKITLASKVKFVKKVINWLEKCSERYRNPFSLILTGGEPFLYPKHIYKIAKLCEINEINCCINTNGSLINSNLKKILNSGLTALTFSIDSHIAQIHDSLRGSIYLFDYVLATIKKIKQKKDNHNLPLKVFVQSILGEWNINTLPSHVNFFKELGMDGIMFQPIQYPFGLQIPENWHSHFKKFPNSETEIQNGINYLLSLKQENGFVMNSKEEIELWKSYFQNPEYIQRDLNPCRAHEQNLIVDVCGNVKFCFNKELEPKNKIGNILTNTIEELWYGKNALQERQSMRSCNRACGIMTCHIDANLRES